METLRIQVYIQDENLARSVEKQKKKFDDENGFESSWSRFMNVVLASYVKKIESGSQ